MLGERVRGAGYLRVHRGIAYLVLRAVQGRCIPFSREALLLVTFG